MKGKSKQNLDTKEGDNDKTVHRVMCIIMDENHHHSLPHTNCENESFSNEFSSVFHCLVCIDRFDTFYFIP